MVARLTESEHWRVSEFDREKAWHLLSILFTIGRPARPAELAARCRLFNVSPEFVEFLCSIPGSPLFLIDGFFVTVSVVAFNALGQFVSKAIGNHVPRVGLRDSGPKGLWDNVVRTYYRKRKGQVQDSFPLPVAKRRLILAFDTDEDNEAPLPLVNKIQIRIKAQNIFNGLTSSMNLPLLHDSSVACPSNVSTNIGCISDSNRGKKETIVLKELSECVDIQQCKYDSLNPEKNLELPKASVIESGQQKSSLCTLVISGVHKDNLMDETNTMNERGLTPTTCLEAGAQPDAFPEETNDAGRACGTPDSKTVIAKEEFGCKEEEDMIVPDTPSGGQGDLVPTDSPVRTQIKNVLRSINDIQHEDKIKFVNGEKTTSKVETAPLFSSAEPNNAKMQPTKPSAKLQSEKRDSLTLGPKVTSKVVDRCTAVSPKQQEQYKKDQKRIPFKEKLKKNVKMFSRENRTNPTSTDPKNHVETKSLPDFEAYIIEEEEGSGGYGTVYKARRKMDGNTVAIKCPHANAHSHHVNNEMKMLEMFGGQNFVIKFEGSFKSNNAECFVLEHVEHDRPEVLKREIDVFQIQWYGYCMFRALSSLHKQGVAHRDVKPGNFLFSRKLNKGYLIDFNLAMDLHKKYGTTSKSKAYSMSFNHVPLPSAESAAPTKARKVTGNGVLESVRQEIAKDSKLPFEPKNMKKRADVGHMKSFPELGGRSIFKSQGADGSGITSTKDATSTRTPSAERLREPRPYSSRKELNRLVQEAMGSPDQKAVRIPASQRKRVAAPLGRVDRKLYLTPMPLHSGGSAVSGAGLLKNKGDGKQKREGPCVGTKGFRAPEVLFKSPHQGFKVDVWSAGVTLLYLMIGKTPFTGDPEQNIKDIAKLKGSEDLWEVAKLHNRESSFPVELFDIQSLPPTNLKEWCEMNTKRPEFLDMIPRSLFELVEKCLSVNPRLRISADEALRHEFFNRCHEDLRKKRLMRRGSSQLSNERLESEDTNAVHKENMTGAVNV